MPNRCAHDQSAPTPSVARIVGQVPFRVRAAWTRHPVSCHWCLGDKVLEDQKPNVSLNGSLPRLSHGTCGYDLHKDIGTAPFRRSWASMVWVAERCLRFQPSLFQSLHEVVNFVLRRGFNSKQWVSGFPSGSRLFYNPTSSVYVESGVSSPGCKVYALQRLAYMPINTAVSQSRWQARKEPSIPSVYRHRWVGWMVEPLIVATSAYRIRTADIGLQNRNPGLAVHRTYAPHGHLPHPTAP